MNKKEEKKVEADKPVDPAVEAPKPAEPQWRQIVVETNGSEIRIDYRASSLLEVQRIGQLLSNLQANPKEA